MKKINVVGTSGSGKSTFSRRLAAKLNYPYIEMDALYWQPNWGEPTDEEFFANLERSLSHTCWVLDGNYNRTGPIKWAEADTIIWLDYAFSRTLFQAVKRALSRCISGRELWPGTGNRESFKKLFFSKDSIVLWTIKTHKSNRQRYQQLRANPKYNHINFVHLSNPKMADEYINEQ